MLRPKTLCNHLPHQVGKIIKEKSFFVYTTTDSLFQLSTVFPALWKSAEAFSHFPFASLNPQVNSQRRIIITHMASVG